MATKKRHLEMTLTSKVKNEALQELEKGRPNIDMLRNNSVFLVVLLLLYGIEKPYYA